MIFANRSLEEILLIISLTIPAIFIGFTFHEFMHAYVADKLGDPTPRNHGRLTLNPLVHIDWIGFFMLLFMGFGWAKPVQTNPRNYKNYKKGRILVSLAGPFANLTLAFLGLCAIYFGRNFFAANEFWDMLISTFVWINTVLFAFNLIPIPPLDGFTLLEMWIKPSNYQKLYALKNYGIMIFIVLAIFGVLRIYLVFVYNIVSIASNWIFRGIELIIGLF